MSSKECVEKATDEAKLPEGEEALIVLLPFSDVTSSLNIDPFIFCSGRCYLLSISVRCASPWLWYLDVIYIPSGEVDNVVKQAPLGMTESNHHHYY
mmetsp:Transcript_7419/g.15932  ORF Transcript_7419/g.15932 Transcript_7419/m.15932 type:complete len:96 (-) Transcript_7419:35-322(-)